MMCVKGFLLLDHTDLLNFQFQFRLNDLIIIQPENTTPIDGSIYATQPRNEETWLFR